jgi:hypothetical protein
MDYRQQYTLLLKYLDMLVSFCLERGVRIDEEEGRRRKKE